jgi:hypothetical protein
MYCSSFGNLLCMCRLDQHSGHLFARSLWVVLLWEGLLCQLHQAQRVLVVWRAPLVVASLVAQRRLLAVLASVSLVWFPVVLVAFLSLRLHLA